MTPGLLITVIIIYILSLVVSLVLMIFSKRFDQRWRKWVVIFHFFLLIVYLFSLSFFKSPSGIFFMIFFCFGISAAGLILRSNTNILLKIYYSLFLLSFLVFLYSPSLLFSLLTQQKFQEKKGNEFLLRENYFLIKQQSMLEISGELLKYKIIRRTGKFDKTLKRDISFRHEIDSLKVLKFEPETEVGMRGYFTTIHTVTDSMDVITDLKMKDTNEITIKRK